MKVCTSASTVKQENGYFSVTTNAAEIRICFLTDSIVRIRAGFDGDFSEESYSLVTTAWEDRMDDFMKGRRKRIEPACASLNDGDMQAAIQGKKLRVVVEKEPFRICVFDEEGTMLHADIVDLAYRKTPITAEFTPARYRLTTASTALVKRAGSLTKPRNLWE